MIVQIFNSTTELPTPTGTQTNETNAEIEMLNDIKVGVFFEKNIEKEHLCRPDKNNFYF